ncbi:hypothetical protein VTO42DRAFT_8796 [Malbranchea cinnamomea]
MADMDEEAVRRLNELQMLDLGSARREYISTVDTANKYRRIPIEAIESARESNRKDSKVYQLVQQHKDSLEAWNSTLPPHPLLLCYLPMVLTN